jgi:hypothetical protein
MMKNDKPLASKLQRMYVQRTEFLLTDQILFQNNEKLVSLNDDMSECNGATAPTNEVYLNINISRSYFKEIDKGMRLGTFLYECGWLEDSLKVLQMTRSLIQELDDDYRKLLLLLNCLQKLLHAQALFCCYKDASITTTQALSLIEQIQNMYKSSQIMIENSTTTTAGVPNSLLANFYNELSMLHFSRSEYDISYKWAVKALEFLCHDTPHKISVDALRQAAKSCVVKRKFQVANLLINSAVRIAENTFGKHHSVFADALLDKGFFLLNVDSINRSVEVYMVNICCEH